MKTPTWAIVVGICLMLFGGSSVTNNIQSINMPDILETQQDMMEKMFSSANSGSSDSLSDASKLDTTNVPNMEIFKNMAEVMQETFTMSEFTKTWTVRFGYIGLFVSIIYMLSGAFLLLKKEFSIKLVYIALVMSIVFAGIQSLVLSSDSTGGLLSKVAGFENLFGIIIDIILIVVVASMDKSAYDKNTKEMV